MYAPKSVTLSGIFISVSVLQFTKAYLPIDLTLSGKTNSVTSAHPEKAYGAIFSTPSGITILPETSCSLSSNTPPE